MNDQFLMDKLVERKSARFKPQSITTQKFKNADLEVLNRTMIDTLNKVNHHLESPEKELMKISELKEKSYISSGSGDNVNGDVESTMRKTLMSLANKDKNEYVNNEYQLDQTVYFGHLPANENNADLAEVKSLFKGTGSNFNRVDE